MCFALMGKRRSIRPRPRLFDDLSPLRYFSLEESSELLRRGADRFRRDHGEALHDVRNLHLAASSAAMLPPAPALLSMITGCPRAGPRCCPSSRATKSLPPPGAAATMSRMGLAGYGCASAAPLSNA